MRKFFVKIALIFTLLFGVLIYSGCAGSQLTPAVCSYGQYVCETAAFLCETIPDIPPEVCTYVNLACLNLSALCEYDPGSPEHSKALKSLETINNNMRNYLIEKKVPESLEVPE